MPQSPTKLRVKWQRQVPLPNSVSPSQHVHAHSVDNPGRDLNVSCETTSSTKGEEHGGSQLMTQSLPVVDRQR